MKKLNLPLIIAVILLLLMLTIMLFPELFTNKSPYSLNKMVFDQTEGELSIESAPFPPSKTFPFGTDDMGRDIYTYIIYGTRLTIMLGVLVALGRFVIALPLAISAGFGNRISKAVIKVFNIVFSAIPAVLISLIILKMDFFTGMDKTHSTISFILVLSLVGWPKISRLIMERTQDIYSQSFIKSEVAIGKKRLMIALENVMPHLAPELIVLQLMEIARSLTIIMTLGVFNVFVGNLKYVETSDWGNYSFYEVSFEPEWASLLATSRSMLASAPWAILFPALAFFISILAFNLLGEGLRHTMQKKDSRAVPVMRKLLTFKVKYLWEQSRLRTKLMLAASLILAAAIIFVPYSIHAGKYNLEESDTSQSLFDQVIIGTEESQKTAEMIAGEMQRLGIQTLENGSYIYDYQTEPTMFLTDYSILFYDGGSIIPAQMNNDYTVLSGGNINSSGDMYDATKDDLFNIKDYSVFEDNYIIIDKEYYTDSAIEYFIKDIQEHTSIKGVLLIARYEDEIYNFFLEEDSIVKFLLSREFADKLTGSKEIDISIKTAVRKTDGTGTNILGIYGPYDPENENKAIIIGMNYNYTKEQGDRVLRFNLDLMQRICETYDNQRSVMFLFVDGALKENNNGLYSISENLPYSPYKAELFIDLTRLSEPSFDSIEFSNALAPYSRAFAWSIGMQLEQSFDNKSYPLDEIPSVVRGSQFYLTESETLDLMFWDRGIATVVVGSGDTSGGAIDVYDLGDSILRVINENSY